MAFRGDFLFCLCRCGFCGADCLQESGLAFLIVAFLYWHLRQQIAVALQRNPHRSALKDKVRLIKEPDVSHNGVGLCFP
jgi:hypothetical protein